MYDGPLQLVALKDSGIRSVADMAGKRIGVGPRGGTTHSYFTAAFKALNIPVVIRNGAYSELTSQFEQHQIDVLASVIGSPVPFLTTLDGRVQLDHIAFAAEEMVTLRQAMPELSPSTVPAGTYASMTSDYQSVGLYNFTVAHKDLPDDLVYAIVKAVFENRERLIAAYPSAKETLAANISRNSFLPFHPGAMRYYREIGVAIPDNLAKTE
jgi:hypothetical protein